MNEILLEVAAKQQELSEGMKNISTRRVEEEDDEEEDEEEEEEEEEYSYLPPNRRAPTLVGPNSVANRGLSFSNVSGNMVNSNVGNVANTIISNVGNNNSRNYYG